MWFLTWDSMHDAPFWILEIYFRYLMSPKSWRPNDAKVLTDDFNRLATGQNLQDLQTVCLGHAARCKTWSKEDSEQWHLSTILVTLGHRIDMSDRPLGSFKTHIFTVWIWICLGGRFNGSKMCRPLSPHIVATITPSHSVQKPVPFGRLNSPPTEVSTYLAI